MRRPVDVPTAATVEFIVSNVPAAATILEVGSGPGHVALELVGRGYDVTGVEADEETVAGARALGAPVVEGSWPDFEIDPVDAIVFTRSLHHMSALTDSVRRSREVLRRDGVLLVEDLALEAADPGTIDWFGEVLRSPTAQRLLAPIRDERLARLLEADDPCDAWRESHDHHLHSAPAMADAIEEFFAIRAETSAPYLYRYLVPVSPETPEAAAFVDEVVREETRLGEAGEIISIGRRTVASPR